MFNNLFFFENLAVFEIMWHNNIEPDRPQMTVWGIRIACQIPTAIKTGLEYVTLIAFPLPQWLHKRTSLLYVYSMPCYGANFGVVLSTSITQ